MNWNPAPWQITGLLMLAIWWGGHVIYLLTRIANELEKQRIRD